VAWRCLYLKTVDASVYRVNAALVNVVNYDTCFALAQDELLVNVERPTGGHDASPAGRSR
jgi:hypothetical protein